MWTSDISLWSLIFGELLRWLRDVDTKALLSGLEFLNSVITGTVIESFSKSITFLIKV